LKTIDNNYQTNQLIVFVHIYSTIMVKMRLSKIDQQFSAVSKRFSDWERLQKRIDEEHAADTDQSC